MAVMVKDEDDHIPEFRPSTFTRILKIPYNAGESWTFPDFRVEVEDGDVDSYNSKFELKFDWNLENHKVPVDKVFQFVTPTQDHPTIQSKGIITMEVTNVSLLSPGVKIDLQIGAYQKGHLVSNLNVPIEVASGPKILPAFSQNVYKFSVPEDIPEGGLIAKISARNHDEIDGVKYTLIGAAAERYEYQNKQINHFHAHYVGYELINIQVSFYVINFENSKIPDLVLTRTLEKFGANLPAWTLRRTRVISS